MTEDHEVQKRLGTTLRDKWTLKRVLGVGGMAAVYVGVHRIGREDAIKILHAEVARSKNVRARFEQEAHAVNRFKHPGVVEIRDIDVAEDGAPFLVMELLEGESLSSRVKRLGSLDPAEVLRVAEELLDVLAAAHAQGIIHRDIKPDNLFVLADGRIKVLDFGIARMREGAPKTMHTKLGSTLGTVAYMPPEQTMGSKIDERADLFSAGATMFRLLAKRSIHQANSEMELLVKMASEAAPPLLSVAPWVHPDIGLVVDRALAFERARRYPDARTMQADIRAVRAGSPPPYATEKLRADGPPSVGVGAAEGAGVAAAALFGVRMSDAPDAGAAAAAAGAGPGAPDLRDSPTVVPGKSAPPGGGLSDEKLGMTNTAWSDDSVPAIAAAPPVVRVSGAPFSAGPGSTGSPGGGAVTAGSPGGGAVTAGSPGGGAVTAGSPGGGPGLGGYTSVPLSTPLPISGASSGAYGRPPMPSQPKEYTPVLARSASRKESLADRVRDKLVGVPLTTLVLFAFAAIVLVGVVVGLWVGLSGSEGGPDAVDSRSRPDPGPTAEPGALEPDPEVTEDPRGPPPKYRGKGKKPKH